MAGALSNPLRLRLLEELMNGPKIVNELVERLGEEQTSVSKHLAILRSANLVSCDVRGRCHRYFVLRPRTVAAVFELISRLCALAEEEEPEPSFGEANASIT